MSSRRTQTLSRLTVLSATGLSACAASVECGADCFDLDAAVSADAEMRSLDAATIEGDAALGPSVEVGTGFEAFEPLPEVIPLSLGPQGGGRIEGYHIWGAVRTKGVEPNGLRVLFMILDAETRSAHARTERLVDLQPVGDGRFVAYGFAPRLHDCCLVRGTSILIHAQVIDSKGGTAWDEKEALAEPVCADSTGADICP
ncbi:MAG: hypothetical protein HYV07_15900 [Deltaproteobacteria bacterium]|nr:hypothetical protein [Deltaproteobacteria bacterium]